MGQLHLTVTWKSAFLFGTAATGFSLFMGHFGKKARHLCFYLGFFFFSIFFVCQGRAKPYKEEQNPLFISILPSQQPVGNENKT